MTDSQIRAVLTPQETEIRRAELELQPAEQRRTATPGQRHRTEALEHAIEAAEQVSELMGEAFDWVPVVPSEVQDVRLVWAGWVERLRKDRG